MTKPPHSQAEICPAILGGRSTDPRSLHNAAKANFDDFYVDKSPIPYMAQMKSIGYEIPQQIRPIFEQLIRRLESLRTRPLRILDVGCSYGVNASLLRYDIDLSGLYEHYAAQEPLRDDLELLVAEDRRFFGGLPERLRGHFTGIDASANAISYATANGVLDDGVVLDLEDDGPWAPAAGSLDIDLIISTGTVGYVGPEAFGRVVDLCKDPQTVWIAVSSLCMIDFEPYTQVFADRGLGTERLPDAFTQRRVVDAVEAGKIRRYAEENGLPAGALDTGKLFANFTLSRVLLGDSESLPELIARERIE